MKPQNGGGSLPVKWCGKTFGRYEKRFDNADLAIVDDNYHPCKKCLDAVREHSKQLAIVDFRADYITKLVIAAKYDEIIAVDKISDRFFDNLTHMQKSVMVRLAAKLR
jgi:hypothetical protein